MRRLLRLSEAPQPGDVRRAEQAMRSSILVTAVRCTIMYLLVPFVAPAVGLLDAISEPLSIVLSSVAAVLIVMSVRRFWRANHRKRWHYTVFAGVVLTTLVVTVVLDVRSLVG
jgi:uncharacterized membrane protein YozB (DUF420 family)